VGLLLVAATPAEVRTVLYACTNSTRHILTSNWSTDVMTNDVHLVMLLVFDGDGAEYGQRVGRTDVHGGEVR